MVPDQDMSLKLNYAVDISPTFVKNGNPIRLREGKMICGSNSKDYAFDNAAMDVPQGKIMVNRASSCQDNAVDMEISSGGHDHVPATRGCNEDAEVDVVGDVNANEERVVGKDSPDVTESSSSFGSANSEAENVAMLSDVEVESQMREDNASFMGFNGFSDLIRPRKKALTPDWRNFIRPLRWRCKLVELQVQELCSRASKYERELEKCHRRKQTEWEKYATEDHVIKSVPFSCQNQRVKLMKRRRRKRVEETVDLASYTSCHDLLSYFAKRRCLGGFVSVDDDDDRIKVVPEEKAHELFGFIGGLQSVDFKHSDAFESILRKIEGAQSQVRQLRVRMDEVMTENAGKFTSDDSSIPPSNQLASCVPHPISSYVDDGSLRAISQQTSGEKLFLLESVVCNNEEGTPLPNMIENNGHPRKCEYMETGSLTYDQPLKQDLNNSEEVAVQRIAEPWSARQGKTGNIQHPNSPSKTAISPEQKSEKARAAFKLTSPKNKRKRGRRKARLGRWNRRSSG